jgi:hypothetical protein
LRKLKTGKVFKKEPVNKANSRMAPLKKNRGSPDARTLGSKSSAQLVDKYLANHVEVNFKD